MPLKLLAAADLHLGRRPRALPQVIQGRLPPRELGPAGAWKRLVELALAEEVHAVLLAGDVVDGDEDFFEAYGELREGVVRLTEAGVQVLAVAGNHDTKVLPYLSDQLESFELLGRSGRWESTVLSQSGTKATIHAWSFPDPWVRVDPVADQSFSRGPGPNLGLLHCDRDQAGSRYAPVASRVLEAADLDGWLLGHVHVPDPISLPRPVGYLGSLTGLDPGEVGPRGAWILSVNEGGISAIEHQALAPLRWLRVTIDLEGIREPEEARNRLVDELQQVVGSAAVEPHPPLAIGVRVTFTGRTRFGREVGALFAAEAVSELMVSEGGVRGFVERVRIETQPELELEELARRDDPAGLLARRLLLLLEGEAENPDRRELLARGRTRLGRTAGEIRWRSLQENVSEEAETEAWLRRAGLKALDLLLAQREDS